MHFAPASVALSAACARRHRPHARHGVAGAGGKHAFVRRPRQHARRCRVAHQRAHKRALIHLPNLRHAKRISKCHAARFSVRSARTLTALSMPAVASKRPEGDSCAAVAVAEPPPATGVPRRTMPGVCGRRSVNSGCLEAGSKTVMVPSPVANCDAPCVSRSRSAALMCFEGKCHQLIASHGMQSPQRGTRRCIIDCKARTTASGPSCPTTECIACTRPPYTALAGSTHAYCCSGSVRSFT